MKNLCDVLHIDLLKDIILKVIYRFTVKYSGRDVFLHTSLVYGNYCPVNTLQSCANITTWDVFFFFFFFSHS